MQDTVDIIRNKSQDTEIFISSVFTRRDKDGRANKVSSLSSQLRNFCAGNDAKHNDNSNSDASCLEVKSLHLGKKGNSYLANNLNKFFEKNFVKQFDSESNRGKLDSKGSTQCSPHTLGSKKGVVIASINVNSLPRHLDKIKLLLKEQGAHIHALNETKMDQNFSSDLLEIEAYKFIRLDRNCNGGGIGR